MLLRTTTIFYRRFIDAENWLLNDQDWLQYRYSIRWAAHKFAGRILRRVSIEVLTTYIELARHALGGKVINQWLEIIALSFQPMGTTHHLDVTFSRANSNRKAIFRPTPHGLVLFTHSVTKHISIFVVTSCMPSFVVYNFASTIWMFHDVLESSTRQSEVPFHPKTQPGFFKYGDFWGIWFWQAASLHRSTLRQQSPTDILSI